MLEQKVIQDTTESSKDNLALFDSFIALNAALHSLSSMLSNETKLALSDLVANEHIRLYGPLSAKEVAHRVQMGSGPTTVLIDRLVKRGFVERVPHPTDRRSVLVKSLAGESTDTPKLGAFLGLVTAEVDALTPSEQRVIAGFLDKITGAVMDTLAGE